jgi:hypothetical protein
MLMNPPRTTLRLVKAEKFGDETTFTPGAGFSLNPFAKNQVTAGFIERVYKARTNRAA